MKFIGVYDAVTVDSVAARQRHIDEYYRTPHGWASGCHMGVFELSLGEVLNYDRSVGQTENVTDTWLKKVACDLLAHFKENGSRENAFLMHAGYSAFIDNERVLAETYVASSGNMVVLIHKKDTATLYIASRRHGIPSLANPFKTMTPREVLLYESQRTDRQWYEYDLGR